MAERMMPLMDHLRDVLQCPICMDEFSKPRVILCGHTFCLACLETMLSKGCTNFDRKLKCPVCKNISQIPKGGIADFQVNVMAIQVQTAVDEAEEMKNKFCEACKTRTSDLVFCRDCENRLCGNCSPKHMKLFPQHVLAADVKNIPTTRCRNHAGKMINMYCSTCREAVCPLCATSGHAGSTHSITSIEEAKSEFIAQVAERLAVLKEDRCQLKATQDRFEKMLDAGNNHSADQRRLVQLQAGFAVRMIKQREEKLLKQIDEIHRNNANVIANGRECVKAKFAQLDNVLNRAEETIPAIEVSDFPDNSITLLKILDEYDRCPKTKCTDITIQKYSFEKETNLNMGDILIMATDTAASAAPAHDPRLDELEKSGSDQTSLTTPKQIGCNPQDQTAMKEVAPRRPRLVGSYVLCSGVDSQSITMVGIGLLENGEVVCAYNTNNMGRVVVCTQSDNQHVLYHRRKDISAFALFGSQECSVALRDDCHISRVSLQKMPRNREATYMTHKISCRASNIGALSFNNDGLMVFFETTKNCINGMDHQNRRSFALSGNRPEQFGMFTTASDLAFGPQGELILYDGCKRRLVLFSSETKLLHYIELPGLSSECSVACDDFSMVYIADCKQNRVVKIAMSGTEAMVDLLDGEHGLLSPSCITVRGNSLAVSNFKTFSEREVRIFEFVDTNL